MKVVNQAEADARRAVAGLMARCPEPIRMHAPGWVRMAHAMERVVPAKNAERAGPTEPRRADVTSVGAPSAGLGAAMERCIAQGAPNSGRRTSDHRAAEPQQGLARAMEHVCVGMPRRTKS